MIGNRARSLTRWTFAALAPLIAGAAGCVTTDSIATTRAANEFHCPEERVVLKPRPDLSDGTYDVEACGHRARYTCLVSYGDSVAPEVSTCMREPLDDDAPPNAAKPSRGGEPDDATATARTAPR